MELNHLRHFYEVAKSGSFTAAARRLRISQSALSKAVALLESHEGVRLFERSKKGVRLTALGTEIFLKSERIFQTLAEIEATCQGTKESCDGPLRLGASDHVINYLLIDKLRELQSEHPGAVPSVVHGTPNDLVDLLLRSEIELALFFTKVSLPGIHYEELRELEMAAVCHPRLLGKEKPGRNLRETLERYGFIGSVGTHYAHHPSRDLMGLAGGKPVTAFESNSQEAQKRFCLAGGGVAYLARFMVESELTQGELAELPLKKPLRSKLLLATRKGRDLPPVARAFLRKLQANG